MKKSIRTLTAAVFLAAGAAHALEVEVNDSLPTENNGRWDYSFTLTNVTNQAVFLTNYYVPYFSDSNIQDLTAPTGWIAEITFQQKFNSNETGVLHWYATGLDGGLGPNQTSGYFSYSAAYGGAKAPFLATFSTGESYTGDPFIPASPMAIAAGFTPAVAAVPEPETYAMMLLGLAGIGFAARRRMGLVSGH